MTTRKMFINKLHPRTAVSDRNQILPKLEGQIYLLKLNDHINRKHVKETTEDMIRYECKKALCQREWKWQNEGNGKYNEMEGTLLTSYNKSPFLKGLV